MLFIAGSIYSIATFSSSLVNNFWWFFFFYAIMCGIGSGLSYIVPIKIVITYFPEKKAMATACILGCYAFSSIVLSFICVSIINPENIKATIIDDQAIFPPQINKQVPIALRYVSLYFFILTIIGSYLMKSQK
jgi:MFS family permease